MAAQTTFLPELDIAIMQDSLDKMRRKLFAELNEVKKENAELTAHIMVLTEAVLKVTNAN